MRSPKDVFSRKNNTASRRDFIDYDYIDKLSEEEQKWLAQVTEEYYGASFEINPTFTKKPDAIKVCKNEIKKLNEKYTELIEKSENMEISLDAKEKKFLKQYPKKLTKWEYNLDRIKNITDKYVQISANKKSKDNIDLRKCRSIKIYRKTPEGNLSQNDRYKYDTIHDFEKYGKDCNDRSNNSSDDIFSVQKPSNQEANDYYMEIQATDELSPEEYMLIQDDYDIMVDCED